MFGLGDIVVMGALFLVAFYWWRAQAAREVALRAARLRCRDLGLQLLDESVALRGFWVKRDHRGALCLWRSYVFDFSADGVDRYQGRIITLADRVEAILLPRQVRPEHSERDDAPH